MKINQVLMESAGATVAFAFGRFNPAHQGHVEVWRTVEQAGANWFIGTNATTLGPNDPLTFEQKSAWMTEIYPAIQGHIIAQTSVLTLAAYIFKKTRKNERATVAYITDAADWAWSGKLLNQYNGVEGAHGYYKFAQIIHEPSPRVSSATALRDAARADDKVAFYHASGTDPKSKVAGLTYFDTVKQAVEKYPLPVKRAKKVKEGWADSIASMLNGKSDLEKINDRRKKLGYEPLLSTPKKITITPAYNEGFKAGTIGFERKENPYYNYQEVTYDLLGIVKQKEADWDRGWLASKQDVDESQLDEIDRRGFLKGMGAAAVAGAAGGAKAGLTNDESNYLMFALDIIWVCNHPSFNVDPTHCEFVKKSLMQFSKRLGFTSQELNDLYATASQKNTTALKNKDPRAMEYLQKITDQAFMRGVARTLVKARPFESVKQGVAEGAMPASVIRIKEKIRLMSDSEKKEYFKGKTREQLQQMAQRHGYGENSNVYAKYATQGVAEGNLKEFAPGAGDEGGGEDPYKYPKPESYRRSADFFGQFEADHFDREDMNDATGEFKGYWGKDQIAYFKFNNPAKTGSDDPGMGWYYEPQSNLGSDDTSAASTVDMSAQRKQQELSMIDAFLKSGQTPKPGSQIYSLMKQHGMAEGAGQITGKQAAIALIKQTIENPKISNIDKKLAKEMYSQLSTNEGKKWELAKGLAMVGIPGAILGGAALHSSNDAPQQSSAYIQQAPKKASITQKTFQQIQSGMSYSQVVTILGKEGELTAQNNIAGFDTRMYSWKGTGMTLGGNMNIMIQNGKVISKAQFGLVDESVNQGVAEDNLKEFAPGNGGGESGRWYTDDQITDIVGDGWYNDLDVSGDIPKQQMIQQAQAWLDDQGYSVQVLNCKVNDDDMEWYIEGSFQNSRFAKKGVAEDEQQTVAKTWDQMTPKEKSSGVKGRTVWNEKTKKYYTVFDVPAKQETDEGWLKNTAAGLALGAAAIGGAQAGTSMDDPSWHSGQYASHVKSDQTIQKQTGSPSVNQKRISDVTGPNAAGEYRITVTQNGKIASQYITKTPPPDWMMKEQDLDEASLATMRDYFAGDEQARDPYEITKQRLHFSKDKNKKPTVDKRFRSQEEYQAWLKQNKLQQISGANESTNNKGWSLINKRKQ